MSNAKKPQMTEDLITDMQFAGVAESLRRVCFFYGNRYVEEKDEKSHNNDADPQVNVNPEQKIYMYQLPNTDAGPYDSARVSPSVLTAFAEDMMIMPHLLHQDEVHQAVIGALDRRRKRAHLPAAAEKTLYDFISVCANKLMEKRPYCNIYSTATMHEKVRALIDFISVDYGQVVFDVLDSRFTPINEVHALQDAVQAETQRRKKRKQKYKTIDAARVGVSELWTHIHEIFLFFCETPLCALSDAEKHVKIEPEKVEQSKTVTTENSEDLQLTCKQSTVQVTVEIEKVNIESVLQFHPSIKKANLFFSARRIQRWYRHKLAEFQQRFIRSAVVSATESTKPLQPLPRPPCGPTVMSLLPRVHALTSKYSLSPHPQSHARVNLKLLEGDGAGNEESAKLPALTVPPLMITRPVHQIIEWKRLIVEECDKGSEASSQSSASVIGISEIPLYNDRLGVWTKHTALLKKPLKLNFKGCTSAVIGPGSLATYNQAATGTRPGTATTRINQGTVGATSESLNVVTPRIVGLGDRRKIEYEHWPNTSRSQPNSLKSTRTHLASTRLCSARPVNRTGSTTDRQQTQSAGRISFSHRVSSASRERVADVGGAWDATSSLSTSSVKSLGGTKLKYPSIFSDNPDERKLALDRMSRQGEATQIKTMKITEEVEALHEHVLEKWRQGTQIYDPFSHKFNQAALKLQRMGRAWLTRKIVREGKFLRDGMKAWLSANLNTAFSSRLAAIQLSEVLKMFKIFGVCPEVMHPPDILRVSLEIIQASDSGKVLDSNKPRMSLTWNEFQELCWRLSFKMGEIKPDCEDELDGLIRVDDLLRVILEGKAEPFDPKRAADWIRQRMLDFAEIQHRDNLSGGPKGKSPLGSPGRHRSLGRLRPPHPDLDLSSVHNQKVPQSTNRFHRAPKSKLESRSERRFERARSVASEGESMTQRERSSKSGSVGGPTQSGDGVGAYVSMCVQLDEEPVPTIQHQLHSSILNLSHYRLKMEQIKALAVGLEKSKCITKVVMIDAGLSSSQAWGILFTAFRLNSAITHVDLSENNGFDKHSVVTLSEFLAKTSTLQHLTLRGVGMTDEAFDKIVRDGIEQNHHKCPKHLDLAYNMLTDTSLENLEYLVLERAGLSAMDLSWNMLSAKAVKKLDLATHQRSKPRSLRREGGNFKKSLEPIALHLEDNQQRFSLMYAHGANGIPRWTPESKGLLSRADYITLCVALSATHTFITSQNQMPFFKFRLIRLMTSGWNLSPEMIAEQLRAHFANVDFVLQGMTVDMLLKKLASSDEIFQLTTLLEDHAGIYVDFVHQHLRALASGSPLEREKSMRSSIGGDF